ncbi:MAG: hypothetical protein R3C11_24300 [Planctomycetaceae bacterium]
MLVLANWPKLELTYYLLVEGAITNSATGTSVTRSVSNPGYYKTDKKLTLGTNVTGVH